MGAGREERETRPLGRQDKTEKVPTFFVKPSEGDYPYQFGEYELLSEMEGGGMSWVFEARDADNNRVVVKTPPQNPPHILPKIARLFQREAGVTKSVNVLGVIGLRDSGVCQKMPFLVTRYVAGVDGCAYFKGSAELSDKLGMLATLAGIVGQMHEQGQAHHDLKFGNVMIEDGQPVLFDLGLAKIEETGGFTTLGDEPAGTIPYMPKQLFRGQPISDPEVDVYALGVMLTEVLTGEFPHEFPIGSTMMQKVATIISEDPRLPSQIDPTLGNGYDELLSRCLFDGNRFADANALKRALLELEHPPSAPAPAPPQPPQPPQPQPVQGAPASPPAPGRKRTKWLRWSLTLLALVLGTYFIGDAIRERVFGIGGEEGPLPSVLPLESVVEDVDEILVRHFTELAGQPDRMAKAEEALQQLVSVLEGRSGVLMESGSPVAATFAVEGSPTLEAQLAPGIPAGFVVPAGRPITVERDGQRSREELEAGEVIRHPSS